MTHVCNNIPHVSASRTSTGIRSQSIAVFHCESEYPVRKLPQFALAIMD